MPAKGTSGKRVSARRAKKPPGILMEAAENIELGAEVVGERISVVVGRTAEVAGDILSAVKKRLHKAYEAGSIAVELVTRSAQEYADKYKQRAETRRLATQRDRLTAKLGLATYRYFKEGKLTPGALFEDKEIQGLVGEIENLDEQVVRIGDEHKRRTERSLPASTRKKEDSHP